MALTEAEQRLLQLFGAGVLGEWARVRQLRRSMPESEVQRALRETALQMHLFAGVPRGVEFHSVLIEAGGLGALEADESRAESEELSAARGRALFERIYAQDSAGVEQQLSRAHPRFAAWILDHAYGRVLSRPGLAPRMRELLACVALALLGQERQLASHARGARRVGASQAEVLAALDCVADLDHAGKLTSARAIAARYAAEPA